MKLIVLNSIHEIVIWKAQPFVCGEPLLQKSSLFLGGTCRRLRQFFCSGLIRLSRGGGRSRYRQCWGTLSRLIRVREECRGSGDRKCSCNSLLTCNRFHLFLWWYFCVLSSLPVSREKRDLVGSAMYAQAPFGHNNMAAAVQCSFHHHHRIMFHLFHYSTSPKRYNIIDTNEHSIEQWKRGFIYYEVRIFNCWNEISGDELVVLVAAKLACRDTLYRGSRLRRVDAQRVETALVRSAHKKVSLASYCD